MLSHLYAIETASTDPYYNLALEELLLHWLPKDSAILYLWQNEHTVVIGKNQNAWKECRTEQLSADGGHLARRSSGGGAVYHDLGNLNFTFLVHKENYDVHRQLSVIAEACKAYGIQAELSGRNDVLANGRKFSGNAFLQTEGKCSHHGTILMNVDMSRMMKYLRPSKEKLQAKGVDSVQSRVVNLCELAPELTLEGLKQELFKAFETIYGQKSEKLLETQMDAQELRQTQQRYASWEWNYGKTFEFSVSFEKRFSWGETQIGLQVQHGMIGDVKVYSDSLDISLPAKLEMALLGRKMSQSALIEAISHMDAEKTVIDDLCEFIRLQNL